MTRRWIAIESCDKENLPPEIVAGVNRHSIRCSLNTSGRIEALLLCPDFSQQLFQQITYFENLIEINFFRLEGSGSIALDQSHIKTMACVSNLIALGIHNNFVSREFCDSLNILKLSCLRITNCQLAPESLLKIHRLDHLEHLSLDGNNLLDDSCVDSLVICSNLKSLTITDTSFSVHAAEWLSENLPGCRIQFKQSL